VRAGLSPERWDVLALVPTFATGLYYLLPESSQALRAVQFTPQALAYFGLLIWGIRNDRIAERLGLRFRQLLEGGRWGLPTGLLLGTSNVGVILWGVPRLGGEIDFLQQTPHAHVPVATMLPWGILLIAIFVELNFRGFLLGRLWALLRQSPIRLPAVVESAVALAVSSLVFSFDPFMVATFRHLHWIALWDGLIWGMIWMRINNLYATIVAHAVEVVVMYVILKITL
jgi:membrane protease YdiL (CAAX protease family)